MIDEQHGRAIFQNESFYLHSGKNVDKVERFVPDIKMCGRLETCRNQYLFLLTF